MSIGGGGAIACFFIASYFNSSFSCFIATVVVAPPVALPVVPQPVLPPRAARNNVPPFPVVHRAILAAVARTPTLVVELVLAAIKRYPCPSKSNDSI